MDLQDTTFDQQLAEPIQSALLCEAEMKRYV